MTFQKLSPHVLVSDSSVTVLKPKDIGILENLAESSGGNVRILLHGDPAAALHEMIIVHQKDTYIQPHINSNSAKSYTVLSGEMAVVIFDAEGNIVKHERLGIENPEDGFFIRFENPVFHTIIALTKYIVFKETILGPHDETNYAAFAPVPSEFEKSNIYFRSLKNEIGIEC